MQMLYNKTTVKSYCDASEIWLKNYITYFSYPTVGILLPMFSLKFHAEVNHEEA